MMKRMMVLLITAVLIVTLIPISAMAARMDDSDVFLTQASGSADCTAAASAMMLRRAALMCGNDNWSSITIEAVKSVGWIYGTGLSASFSCEGFNVGHGRLSSDYNEKINWLIEYLKNHREGIVVFTETFIDAKKNKNWHAILLTDYDEATGTFYCGDSGNANLSGRRPVSDSTMETHIGTTDQATIMSYFKTYWYITNSPTCQHQFTTEYAAASAAADGYDKEYCTVCGYVNKNDILHNWDEGKVVKQADSKKISMAKLELVQYTCTCCGSKMTKEQIKVYTPAGEATVTEEKEWSITIGGDCVIFSGELEHDIDDLVELLDIEKGELWSAIGLDATDMLLDLIIKDVTWIPDNFFKGLRLKSVDLSGVTRIGSNAFEGCSITELLLPSTLQSLGEYAFKDCLNLRTVQSNVTNMVNFAASAFSGCTNISTLHIPYGVTKINDSEYANKTNLTNVIIPPTVTIIGSYAFAGCTSLESVVIPDSVTSIYSYAFKECTSLKKITMPISAQVSLYANGGGGADVCILDSCNNIEEVVFTAGSSGEPGNGAANSEYRYLFQSSRSTLKSIRFEEGVKVVPSYICYWCSLTSAYLPSTLETIGERAFQDCAALKDISIPDSVTIIGSYAFSGCASIPSITLPSGITTINENTFSSCTSLTSVTIPNTVTSIGGYAFAGCTAITDVYFGGTEEQWKAVTIASGNDPLINANIHFTDTPTGDITGDNKVDITDLIRLKKFIADDTTEIIGSADLNGDNKVDILDLIRLKKIIAGETSFS